MELLWLYHEVVFLRHAEARFGAKRCGKLRVFDSFSERGMSKAEPT
jgi:hypothetical protein